MNNDELYHYGVKGMKWGVRKNRNAHNKNYSDRQRKNDRAFYGSRGEKRINKKLNEGYGLRGARHFEVERKERVTKRKKKVKRIAKKTARAAVSVGSAFVYDQVFMGGMGTRLVRNLGKSAIKDGKRVASRLAQLYYDTHPIYEHAS